MGNGMADLGRVVASLALSTFILQLFPRCSAFLFPTEGRGISAHRHRPFPSSNAAAALSATAYSSARSYDLVVIGGGSAGLTAAKFAATFGFKAVIVERAKLGGDCTWTGCVPSKSLIASGKAANLARKAGEYGIIVGGGGTVKVDMKAVRERLRENMRRIYEEDDSPEAMAKLGIDTIEGSAHFVSPSAVIVSPSGVGGDSGAIEVTAREGIVIATGAKPRMPSIEGLDTVDYMTYEGVFDLDEVPDRMTVVGGGPIGCELAQVFGRLGSTVTVVADR